MLEAWSTTYGCHQLTVEAMAPRLDRVWETIGVTINPVAVQRNNNLIFQKGAEALGLPGGWLPRSAPGCIGCGVCQMGCPTGGKWSTDRTFLAEAIATGNTTVHADCRVEGAETEGGSVRAITGRTIDPTSLMPAGRFRVQADSFVLCAGPVGSPRFLLSNGFADDTVCGRNLHVHPAAGMLARFEQEIRPWSGVTQGYYVDRWERGYLLQTYSTSPDQTYLAMPQSLGPTLIELLRDFRNMAMAGPLVHDDDSVGRVSLSGITYFLGEHDRRRMLAGLRECAEVFFAAGALEVYTGIVGNQPIRDVNHIDDAIPDDVPARQMYLYASHPMGTCRMGDDPATSVIDPQGRVWGCTNLYIADSSTFPTSLGVNPQVTTMALGLMVGEGIAGGG